MVSRGKKYEARIAREKKIRKWVTIAEYARAKKMTRQSVHHRIKIRVVETLQSWGGTTVVRDKP